MLSVLESQVELVRARIDAFSAQFRKHAYRTAWSILDESERRVRAEMERYGMTADRKMGFGGARSIELPETEAMRAAAKQMATSKQGVDALAKKRNELVSGFGYPNIMSTMPKGESSPGDDEERAELAAIDAQIDAAELQHVQLRMVLESQYPALAQYKSTGGLEKIANNNDSGADQMAWDLDGNLINIAKARDALASNDLDPMTLPDVVGMAQQALMVRPNSMRSRVVDDMVSDAQPSRWRAIAIAVIAIGIGLLAIPLSGGASMGAAPVLPWLRSKASDSGSTPSYSPSRSVSTTSRKPPAEPTPTRLERFRKTTHRWDGWPLRSSAPPSVPVPR